MVAHTHHLQARVLRGACLLSMQIALLFFGSAHCGETSPPLPRPENLSAADLLARAADLSVHVRERELAASLLGERDTGTDMLIQGLTHERGIVRQIAAILLGRFGLVAGEESLLRTAADDGDPLLTQHALTALERIASTLPPGALLPRLSARHDQPQVLAATLRGLARSLEQRNERLNDELEGTLRRFLRHAQAEVRAGAALGLGFAAGTDVPELLLLQCEVEKDAAPLKAVCQALARLKPALNADPLLVLLRERDDPLLALQAALALRAMKYDDTEAVLEALLGDKRPHVRLAVVEASRQLRDPHLLPLLVGACGDPVTSVRREAAAALAEAADPDARAALLALRDDPDPGVRSFVLGQLLKTGTVVGLETRLIDDLVSTDTATRAEAARALASSTSAAAVRALAAALGDPDLEVACRAAESLARRVNSRDPALLEGLATALRDPRPAVSYAAADALAALGLPPGNDPQAWNRWALRHGLPTASQP